METNGFVTYGEGIFASDYQLKNLSLALAAAQMEFDAAHKTAENKFESFFYTDLNALITAVRTALTKHGLTVIQFCTADLLARSVTVKTCLIHPSSGEWSSHDLSLPAEGTGRGGTPTYNQKTIGAAITYGRKYGLKTLVGIADASDDDVDKQEGNPDLSSRRTPQARPQPKRDPSPQPAPAAAPEADSREKSLLNAADRKTLLFDGCYTLGGTNDHIQAAILRVTGQSSSKLVKYGDVEKIKAEVYKLANPGSGEKTADWPEIGERPIP
jgi:hypothetical protein